MKILVVAKPGRFQNVNKGAAELTKYEFNYADFGASDDEILSVGRDADIMVVDPMLDISRNLIENMPNLKMIHSEGVAFNRIDLEAAKENNVYVCNCKGMNASAVAEHAIMLMLGLLRFVCVGNKAVHDGRQIEFKNSLMGSGRLKELSDCTIGLMGFGDIAKKVAEYAHVMGADVVYYDLFRADAEIEEKYHVTYMMEDALLAKSDIVSLHLPVTSQTVGSVNKEFFMKMKKGSYIINTARGDLVNNDDLVMALSEGHIEGAALDTVAPEPVTLDNPLLKAPEEIQGKIIYSCHLGGITDSSFKRGYKMIWSDIAKIAAGQRPDRVVNKL